jgi:hypothetical protein
MYPPLVPNFFGDDFDYGDPIIEDPDLGESDDNWALGTLNVEDDTW